MSSRSRRRRLLFRTLVAVALLVVVAMLAAWAWIESKVRYDLERAALVDNYVQVRYRDVIDVRESEIRRYYEDVLRPEMAREGVEMPAFDAVDSMLEAILVGDEYNRRIDDWITDLRRRADIVVYIW